MGASSSASTSPGQCQGCGVENVVPADSDGSADLQPRKRFGLGLPIDRKCLEHRTVLLRTAMLPRPSHGSEVCPLARGDQQGARQGAPIMEAAMESIWR